MKYMKKTVSLLMAAVLALVCVPLVAMAEDNTVADKIAVYSGELTLEEEGEQILPFSVGTPGRYVLWAHYEAIPGKSLTPEISVTLDAPYVEDTGSQTMPRLWTNQLTGDRFAEDEQGNELRPAQKELTEWQDVSLSLNEDSADKAVDLTAGEHTLTLHMVREGVVIRELWLQKPAAAPTYEAYQLECSRLGAADTTGCLQKTEGELFTQKSRVEIVATYDRTLPSISPSDPALIRYNILGGSSWAEEGDWVSWTVDAPETGYYQLDVTYRQNTLDGASVRRRIYIDDQVPFEDMNCVTFAYSRDFQTKTIADEQNNPYRFYLTKGSHTLRMEVVLGEAKSVLKDFQSVIYNMNTLYNQINVIVGNQSDAYRDYDLDQSIPDLLPSLRNDAQQLRDIVSFLNGSRQKSNSQTARMEECARTLDNLAAKPEKIPTSVDYFRTQINTMADVLSSMLTQPLELDYFTLRSPDSKVEPVSNNFFEYLAFRTKAFLSSFTQDYQTVTGTDGGKALQVWASSNDTAVSGFATGRDQAQIVSQLATNDFSVKENIPVQISLVSAADTLLQAVASGRGPDVVLFTPKSVIANLYFRDALVALDDMPGFQEICARVNPSALISLQTGGKTYALPEVQMFNMLFYRKDILEQLDLQVPETWDEFYDAVFRIQGEGMQLGVTESQLIFEMFLLQNDTSLYTDDLSKTRLTEQASVTAFKEWTDLYAKYSFPLSFDMLNRFRTGQMPMVIGPYNFYSNVAVSAPEIKGLWGMAQVPGTVQTDGTVNHSESCSISGAVVLNKSGDEYDRAFRFVRWWTQTDVQNQFGFESETRVGVSARYAPANKETMGTLAWSKEEYNALNLQWKSVSDMPQTPATYFVTRNLSNSFRRVVYDYENPRDVIYRYGQDIDNELTRKRMELGLN